MQSREKRCSAILLAAATSFTLQLVYMFQQLGVLGGP